MKIHVKSLAGHIELDLTGNETVLDIKHMIQQREPIFNISSQRLIDPDEIKYFPDRKTVRELGWTDGKELWIMIKHYNSPPLSKLYEILDEGEDTIVRNGLFSRNNDIRYTFRAKKERLEEEFNFIRGYQYVIPLRHVEIGSIRHIGRSFINPDNANVMYIKCLHNMFPFDIEADDIFLTGNFKSLEIHKISETRDLHKTYTITLVLEPPFSAAYKPGIESNYLIEDFNNMLNQLGNNCEIFINYYNLVPREVEPLISVSPKADSSDLEFTGRRSKSLKRYIRRSVKKELRKLMK